ncbi:YgaP family membrane protein [Ferruginibacter sp.]
MKNNMGTTDRIIRTLIAVVIAILYFTNIITGTLGIVLLVLAVIFVLTSLVSFCPLYTLVGLSTCPVKNKDA